MVSVEEDDLAGLEDVSSDGEDDNYEAEMTDGEPASSGNAPIRKAGRKKSRGIIPLSFFIPIISSGIFLLKKTNNGSNSYNNLMARACSNILSMVNLTSNGCIYFLIILQWIARSLFH